MDSKLAALITYLQHQRHLMDYTFMSAVAILIYDYALTLHLEIKYIWFSKWSYAKVLFLLVRYMNFVTIFILLYEQLFLGLSEEECVVMWTVSGCLVVFGTLFAEIILCVRTWAIWNRNNVVSMLLVTMMSLEIAVASFLYYHLTRSFQFGPPPYIGFRGCLVTDVNRLFLWTQYAALLAVEIVVFTLVVVSAFRLYRTGRKSELSFIIHRDGVLFYLYLILLTGTNVVIASTAPLDLISIMIPIEDALHSVFTLRIVLNIRSISNRGQDTELHTGYLEAHVGPVCLQPMPLREHLPDGLASDELEHGDRNAIEDSHTKYCSTGAM